MRVVCCLLFVACASSSSVPPKAAPWADSETIQKKGGDLALDAWPDIGVSVRGETVTITAYAEGAPDNIDALRAHADAEAASMLAGFIETAAQQLDLHLQAAGQAPASNDEQQAIRARPPELGAGRHAWQTLMRDEQCLSRVFVRYTVKTSALATWLEQGLGERPKKADIARKTFAAFEAQ